MDLPRVPPSLVGGTADLGSLFVSLGRYRNIPREDVEEIAALVPPPIKGTPCFLDRLTGLWRYDFGEPLNLPGDSVVLNTNMYQPVDRLYDVLACARRRLTGGQLSNYLQRLADPNKHDDLLFEFAPIVRLPLDIKVSYEVSGYGEGHRTVDWVLQPPSGPLVAIDVKNRTRDLVESLARLQAGEREADGAAPAPRHDVGLLFVGLEAKFRPRSPSEVVHAAWIGTDLKQEETELAAAFERLDRDKIHVALLGDWNDDVYILAHDVSARQHAVDVLGVRESKRFVFRRNEG